jgi:hypothetical protein
VYQLECVVEQKRRLPVSTPILRKTPLTRLAPLQEVEAILRQHGGRERAALSPLVQQRGRENKALSPLVTSPEVRVPLGTSPSLLTRNDPPCRLVPPPCQPAMPYGVVSNGCQPLVSNGYQPLDETNIGNRMLQHMGWQPGAGLGAESDGMTSPVRAYFRAKQTAGLGFTNQL